MYCAFTIKKKEITRSILNYLCLNLCIVYDIVKTSTALVISQ